MGTAITIALIIAGTFVALALIWGAVALIFANAARKQFNRVEAEMQRDWDERTKNSRRTY